MTIDEIIQKYPKLNFLKSPLFQSLSKEKFDFLLECVEDARFWVEMEKNPSSTDGFKFLAASFGMQQAEAQANAKGLQGEARSKFLRSAQELLTQFNPHAGLPGIEE